MPLDLYCNSTVIRNFKQTIWEDLLLKVKVIGSMSSEEVEIMKASPAARILAATAFISGCLTPELSAYYSILSLLAVVRDSDFFLNRPGQSIRERVLLLMHFAGGIPEVIEYAGGLLELIAINYLQWGKNGENISDKTNKIRSFFGNRNALLKKLDEKTLLRNIYQELFTENIFLICRWW